MGKYLSGLRSCVLGEVHRVGEGRGVAASGATGGGESS